jgi:hypothetical protein
VTENPEDWRDADEIAVGMRRRCADEIKRQGRTVIGVVFSTADVLTLLDAYDAHRRAAQCRHWWTRWYPSRVLCLHCGSNEHELTRRGTAAADVNGGT